VSGKQKKQVHVASIFITSGWRRYGPPKYWYPTIILHGVTTQKTVILIASFGFLTVSRMVKICL